ncbi:unnamed protein product [Haemonchus placei]|uniref:Uncharacterized protein n=1 Tax=Haemonchus placei TaxID=6290 RepID=A0A3P7VXP7_HAEPC|nr:unnamed protein product [Haemonchus placei]
MIGLAADGGAELQFRTRSASGHLISIFPSTSIHLDGGVCAVRSKRIISCPNFL